MPEEFANDLLGAVEFGTGLGSGGGVGEDEGAVVSEGGGPVGFEIEGGEGVLYYFWSG